MQNNNTDNLFNNQNFSSRELYLQNSLLNKNFTTNPNMFNSMSKEVREY